MQQKQFLKTEKNETEQDRTKVAKKGYTISNYVYKIIEYIRPGIHNILNCIRRFFFVTLVLWSKLKTQKDTRRNKNLPDELVLFMKVIISL